MIDLLTAVKRIKQTISLKPAVGLVLGSGLGDLAAQIQQSVVIPYADIPEFPKARVAGHAGNLVAGTIEKVPVIAMQGRAHFYEGHPMDKVVFGVRIMKLLGAETLITTNAVGAINRNFRVGQFMLIRDHLNFLGDHPLRGPNLVSLGPRFYDMTYAYDLSLRKLAVSVARGLKIRLAEGVYAACPGPSYETPAEIRMLRLLGADAVGMSTVPEILAARHMSMRCLGISLVCNMAAGVTRQSLSHEEVIDASKQAAKQFERLILGILKEGSFTVVPAARPQPVASTQKKKS